MVARFGRSEDMGPGWSGGEVRRYARTAGAIRRAVRAATLGAALCAATACGSDGPTSPPVELDDLNGAWMGTTEQGRPFQMLVENDAVVLAVIGFRVQGSACVDDGLQVISREPPAASYALTDDMFSISTSGSRGSITIAGTLGVDGRATGQLTVQAQTCNGSLLTAVNATHTAAPSLDFSGDWSGSFATSLTEQFDGTLELTQTGAAVSGTFVTNDGEVGTIAGTVRGRMLTFTITQTIVACGGEFRGHAVALTNPEELAVFYSGSDCFGTHTGGTGSAQR